MTNIDFEPEKKVSPATIYEDKYVQVQCSEDIAVPGLYIIRPSSNKESVTELSDTELAVFSYFQRQIRLLLRRMFNLELCGLYFEEHPGQKVTSYTIPFHIDMLTHNFSVDLYQPHIADYLKIYSSSSAQEQINTINTKMNEILNSRAVKDEIENITSGIFAVSESRATTPETYEESSEIEGVMEVFDEKELPVAPDGKKYFVCIGGKKNFQCFLSDNRISKGEFLSTHEDELDNCLKCIYSDDQIVVRQDAKYAIPGFYIVSTRSHYRTIDEMPQDLFERCMFVARDIKRGLIELGIKQSHIYNDEKYKSPASVHFWVLPIHKEFIKTKKLNPTIFSKDIWVYLETFPRFIETKSQIIEINKKMKRFLDQHSYHHHQDLTPQNN